MTQRQIEFRGKSVGDNDWFYGLYCCAVFPDTKWYSCINITDELSVTNVKVKPESIGQCTGLKDKYGNKIFEGDIVKYRGIGKKEYALAEVTFSDATFYACYRLSDLMPVSIFDTEIIGNVFDNPEILGLISDR